MAGDGQTDFYAEIGIKLNESQAKKEAAKGAKITADSIESAMIKAVQEVQAKQRKALSSIMPKRQGFSLKESLKSGGSYMSSIQGKAFSAQEYMKEREVWQKIIDKNDAALEKELQRAFKEEEKKNKQKALQEKAFQREQEKTLKEELNKEKLLDKENEKRIAKRLKEDEAERKRINKKDEADRKAKEKAERNAQKEKERRQKQEERLKEKAYRKDIARIKSLGKWTLGTAIAGGYLAQRVMNQSEERAFGFRNVQDIGVDYKTLRKWQAASKVFGNIKEEESAQSLVNLRNYIAKMKMGEAASPNFKRLLGVDWWQKDERKLVNDISNAILRQNKDIQGVLTEEVFGSQKYLSVLKRFQENPQEVWDVEKNILGGSLTQQQIKDVDELGQSFRFTSLQAENFKDQIVAIASTDLKKWIKDVGNSLEELTPNLKSIWSGVKTTAKILGAPAEAIYKAGEWATGFMTEAVQSDLYNESKWKAQDRFDAEMRRRAQIETAQSSFKEKPEKTENNKNITVNVGGVTVNKNQDIQETVKQAVWGATSAFEKETTNMFVELPTLGR